MLVRYGYYITNIHNIRIHTYYHYHAHCGNGWKACSLWCLLLLPLNEVAYAFCCRLDHFSPSTWMLLSGILNLHSPYRNKNVSNGTRPELKHQSIILIKMYVYIYTCISFYVYVYTDECEMYSKQQQHWVLVAGDTLQHTALYVRSCYS